jgi:hypothetical protein
MQLKTKNLGGNRGLKQNQKQSDDILQRRARLQQSLRDAFNAGLIPASWAVEIAKIGGCHV